MCTILNARIRFVSRRTPTIGSFVSPSAFTRVNPSSDNCLSTKGFHGCCHTRCVACSFATNTKSITSKSTGNIYPICCYIKCNTKCIIYLVTCTSCRIQYVGCTMTPLKVRIRRHLSGIHRPLAVNISTVSWHFS